MLVEMATTQFCYSTLHYGIVCYTTDITLCNLVQQCQHCDPCVLESTFHRYVGKNSHNMDSATTVCSHQLGAGTHYCHAPTNKQPSKVCPRPVPASQEMFCSHLTDLKKDVLILRMNNLVTNLPTPTGWQVTVLSLPLVSAEIVLQLSIPHSHIWLYERNN